MLDVPNIDATMTQASESSGSSWPRTKGARLVLVEAVGEDEGEVLREHVLRVALLPPHERPRVLQELQQLQGRWVVRRERIDDPKCFSSF